VAVCSPSLPIRGEVHGYFTVDACECIGAEASNRVRLFPDIGLKKFVECLGKAPG